MRAALSSLARLGIAVAGAIVGALVAMPVAVTLLGTYESPAVTWSMAGGAVLGAAAMASLHLRTRRSS
jgi:hypothetical protein